MSRILCIRGALLAGVLAAAGCTTPIQLTSGETNMCMNVINHGSPEPGAAVIMKVCDPWQNQQWVFDDSGQVTGVGGFCLDVQGSAPTDGARVIYTPCSGSPSQRWSARNGAVVGIGGKCLDIAGGYPAQGAPLIITPCNGSPSQQWVSH